MSTHITPNTTHQTTINDTTSTNPVLHAALRSTLPPNAQHFIDTASSNAAFPSDKSTMDAQHSLTPNAPRPTTHTPRRTPGNDFPYGKAQMHNIGTMSVPQRHASPLVNRARLQGPDIASVTPSKASGHLERLHGMAKATGLIPGAPPSIRDLNSPRPISAHEAPRIFYETPAHQQYLPTHPPHGEGLGTAHGSTMAPQVVPFVRNPFETPSHGRSHLRSHPDAHPAAQLQLYTPSGAAVLAFHPNLPPRLPPCPDPRTHLHRASAHLSTPPVQLPTNAQTETPQTSTSAAHLYAHFPSLTHIKRRRKTSPEELAILEEAYVVNALPSSAERNRLSRMTGMSPRGVQIWFQNKRQTEKRKQQTNAHASSQSSPHPLAFSSPATAFFASGSTLSSSPTRSAGSPALYDSIRRPGHGAMQGHRVKEEEQIGRQAIRPGAAGNAGRFEPGAVKAESFVGQQLRIMKSEDDKMVDNKDWSRAPVAEDRMQERESQSVVTRPRPMYPVEIARLDGRERAIINLVEGESPTTDRSRQAPSRIRALPVMQSTFPSPATATVSSDFGTGLAKARIDPHPAPLPRPLSRTGRPLCRASSSSSGLLDMKSEMLETEHDRSRIRGWEPSGVSSDNIAGRPREEKENQRPSLGQRASSVGGLLSLPVMRISVPDRPRSGLGFTFSLPPPRPHSTTGVAPSTQSRGMIGDRRLPPIASAIGRNASRGILDEMCMSRELPWMNQDGSARVKSMDNMLDRMQSSPGELLIVDGGSETDVDDDNEAKNLNRKRKSGEIEVGSDLDEDDGPRRLAPFARSRSAMDTRGSDARPMLRRLASLDYYAGTPPRRNSMIGSHVRRLEAVVAAEQDVRHVIAEHRSWGEQKWEDASDSRRTRSSFTRASSDDSFATGASTSVNILTPNMDSGSGGKAVYGMPGSSPSGRGKFDEHDKECAFLLLGLGNVGNAM